MEPSVPIHTLVKLDANDITLGKIRTLDLPLEISRVTSKLEAQKLSAEKFSSNPELLLTHTTDPNNRSKHQFQKYGRYFYKSNHSFSNCCRKQREEEEKKRKFSSRSKSPAKHLGQYLKAYLNQSHPNEQPSTYRVNSSSVFVVIQKIFQTQVIKILRIDLLVLDHLQPDVDHRKRLLLNIAVVIEIPVPIELHLVQDTLNSSNQRRTSRSPDNSSCIKNCYRSPPKIMCTTMKIFQSQKTNLKLTCITLK